jgi:ATP-dependent DNA helicase DinG
MPSRLLDAFPPGLPIRRVPLDEAVKIVAERLSSDTQFRHQESDQEMPGTR